MPSNREFMAVQVEALFTFDAAGRMQRTNEPNAAPAPRFFLGRTKAGHLWRFRYDLPAGLVQRLDALAASEPVVAGLPALPACIDGLRDALSAGGGTLDEYAGPAYRFPEEITAPSRVVTMTTADAHLLRETFPSLVPEVSARQPCMAVVQDGAAVSVCLSARRSYRAAEAGVETHEAFRGRGHATAVTAAWALAVRSHGLVPLYSTSWENTASQGVARRLGLIVYGVDLDLG